MGKKELIRQWYLFYNQKNTIAKQPVSQLETNIRCPNNSRHMGYNIAIISKCKNIDESLYSPGRGDLFVEINAKRKGKLHRSGLCRA